MRIATKENTRFRLDRIIDKGLQFEADILVSYLRGVLKFDSFM